MGGAADGGTGVAVARGPARGGLVLATLILGAAVANLNMAVANVALPDIGKALGASQTALNLVAVGFTLGLAASVLYLGALSDHHGRRLMLIAGLAVSIPTAALAAWAPSIEVLILARLLGGLAAGMAFPTTLSLISALFKGVRQTKAIALWSGIGGGASAVGPLVVGALLTRFWWGSAFVLTIPLAVLALALVFFCIPKHAGESSEPVDNMGGIVSVVLVASVVLAISFAPVPGAGGATLILAALAILSLVGFVLRERRAANPLFDLAVARRRVFWVAALAGIIVFGALMGSMFIGQQFLQDVLGYSTLQAGAAILPAAVMMVLMSGVSAKLIQSRGARTTLIFAYILVGAGFVMMMTWKEGVSYLPVGAAYALVGAGVGLGGAPASRSIMTSVPTRRAGMGSATNDLQRDLGGAIMQSVLGALLSVRYASYFTEAFATLPPAQQQALSQETATMLKSSFGGAAKVAELYPGNAELIMSGAKEAFTKGSVLAIGAALVAVVVGLVLIIVFFPGKGKELELEAAYAREDAGDSSGVPGDIILSS